jgi:hypothetical protein
MNRHIPFKCYLLSKIIERGMHLNNETTTPTNNNQKNTKGGSLQERRKFFAWYLQPFIYAAYRGRIDFKMMR